MQKTSNFFGKAFCVILLVLATIVNAQSKFVRPGAQWSYAFKGFFAYQVYPITCSYAGDTLLGGDTCHKIRTPYIYLNANGCQARTFTLLKQKADSVFFKNSMTQNTWQLLYKLAASVGDSWTLTVLPDNSAVQYLTITVDSTGTRQINNTSLNYLVVTMTGGLRGTKTFKITERIGTSLFLFNIYKSECETDQEDFLQFLCYKDNEIGTWQPTNKPCNYKDFMSINDFENSESIQISPNPSSGIFKLNFSQLSSQKLIANIYTPYAQLISSREITGTTAEVNLTQLPKGIYYLELISDNLNSFNYKLVLE